MRFRCSSTLACVGICDGSRELLLADREIGLIGQLAIQKSGLSSARPDFRSGLARCRQSADERCNFGELHVEFSLLDIGLAACTWACAPASPGSRYRVGFAQWPFLGPAVVSFNVLDGLAQLGISLRELRLRLVECGLEGTGIDLEQDLSLLHDRAFLVILFDHVSRYARLDLGIYVAIEDRYPSL